jgi:hypothetical protein
MRVFQLTAEPENNGKERQSLVAEPAAGSGQVTVSLIIPTLNEAKNLAHALPASPAAVDTLVIVDGGSTVSAAG